MCRFCGVGLLKHIAAALAPYRATDRHNNSVINTSINPGIVLLRLPDSDNNLSSPYLEGRTR